MKVLLFIIVLVFFLFWKRREGVDDTTVSTLRIDTVERLVDQQDDQLSTITTAIATIKAQKALNKPDTKVPNE